MFTKSAAFFCVLAASSVFAVPIPKRQIGSPAVCNVGTVQAAIADMRATADSILKVGIPLPDDLRRNPADVATFDTVVSALADADAAVAVDFKTVSAKIDFVADAVNGLIGNKAADGQVSALDLDLFNAVSDIKAVAAACAFPAGAPAARAVPPNAKVVVRAVCDANLVKDNIVDLRDTADAILQVGFVLPDDLRRNPADVATFDTVVAALADADNAAIANDFATVSSKVNFAKATVEGLIGNKAADGQISSLDLDLFNTLVDTVPLAADCL